MPPARKSAAKTEVKVEVVCKDEPTSDEEEMDVMPETKLEVVYKVDPISDDEEMDITPASLRRSTRTPKPVQKKKSLSDASDSSEHDKKNEEMMSKIRGRTPDKKATGSKKANGTPTRGKKQQQPPPKKTAGKAKKPNRGSDENDEDFAGDQEENEEEEKEEDEDDDVPLNLDGLENEQIDPPDWTAPDYKDQKWFKENCLKCQECKKTFPKTGQALACFNKHKHCLRCFVCFTVIKGKKNATKKLFKHYQMRHPEGDKANTVKCPHCDESVAYKSVSCHIIIMHFREALRIPQPKPTKKNGRRAKGQRF